MKIKDSELEKMLKVGWAFQEYEKQRYITLVRKDEELVYDCKERRVVSIYKK